MLEPLVPYAVGFALLLLLWLLYVASVGGNTWQLLSRLLHIKARAPITDEVLHFSLCWLVLTALLPASVQPFQIRPSTSMSGFCLALRT